MKQTRTILSCALLFAGTVLMMVPAGAEDTIAYNNAKAVGMGNTKIAGGFSYNGFVDNPALLSRVSVVRFSIANIPIGINKDLSDIAQFIQDNSDKFEEFDSMDVTERQEFMDEIGEFDGRWGRLGVYPMVDFAVNILGTGIGLAVFNNTDIALKLDEGIYEPRVWGEGKTDMAVVFGIAKPLFMLYPGLTVGANVKYMERRRASLFQIPASDLGDVEETFEPVLDEIKENVHKTIAVDVGGLLDLPLIGAEVGATLRSIGDGRGSSLDLGIAKQMFGDNLTLLADYIDFLDNNKENVFKKMHFGAEYRAAILAFRAGVSEGYPALGFGLDFKVIDIDAAWYTDELSKGPGGKNEERYLAQIKIGW